MIVASTSGPRRRRGAVAIKAALSLPILLGVAALALDGGMLLQERRIAQAAADAAAMAAATELYVNFSRDAGQDPTGTAESNGKAVAAANGYADDGIESVVKVNIPPQSGAFQGKAGYAEATIESKQRRSFSAIWGLDRMTVTARAVARGQWPEFGAGIILLHPSKDDAFQFSGNGTIDVEGAIIVNSTSSKALNMSGNGTLEASAFNITGNYVNSGDGSLIGDISTGVPPTPDPLAFLPAPVPADYPPIRSSEKLSLGDGSYTLWPGRYQGGIDFSGKGTVTMQPGIYIIEGGGFKVQGDGTLNAQEVMVYNTKWLNSDGSVRQDADQFYISAQSHVSWTPPTTGIYMGISVFQERTIADKKVQISGNGDAYISGLVYARDAEVQLSGNGTTSSDIIGGGIVASSLQVSGDGTLGIGFGDSPRPRIPKRPALVE